jgi:cyclic pyranopterin phosphate synthase
VPGDDVSEENILDTFGRPLRSLRLSVTDRCNLRCLYCMPEEEYAWLPQQDFLSFDELETLAGVFTSLGVRKIRLTGGEPLLRKDLPSLVARLARNPHITDLALTTNGVLLAEQAEALRRAGLHRVTISLDTLRPERFLRLARRESFSRVQQGIAAAARAGFTGTKLDAVLIRGYNEDEAAELLEFGQRAGIEVRFLEYMDVPGATAWSIEQVVSRLEILTALSRRFGVIVPLGENGSAPATRYLLPDGTIFGIVASTTTPFCRTCDRARLTADGVLFLCLYATAGINLRQPLRAGASRAEMAARIRGVWGGRRDRGAETRQHTRVRHVFVPVEALRRDPHLEMHTRGG